MIFVPPLRVDPPALADLRPPPCPSPFDLAPHLVRLHVGTAVRAELQALLPDRFLDARRVSFGYLLDGVPVFESSALGAHDAFGEFSDGSICRLTGRPR